MTIITAWTLVAFSFSGAFAQEWERVLEKDGIVVYERQRSNAPVRDFRAEMVIDSSPLSVMALMDDTEAAPRWFTHCRRLVRVSEISSDEHIVYNITRFPWPMRDRDAVLRSVRRFEKENKRFVIDYRSVDNISCPPAEPGLSRVVTIEGQWGVTALGRDRTLVTSRIQMDLGTPLPGWTLNPFLREATYQTFVNIRQVVQEPKYRNAMPTPEYMQRFGVSGNPAVGRPLSAGDLRISR
ncbi:MAG: START domain-containing protein [Thermodesulfobacteriota bacterium]